MGGNVFRPIGMEWAEQGFWKVYDHPETQAQYLGIGAATPDGTPPLNDAIDPFIGRETGIYLCKDIEGNETNKAITLSTFYRIPIDIVIASLPQHIEPFIRLCALHPNKPKLIYHIGNSWNIPMDTPVKNIMASAHIPYYPDHINLIQYHQEFNTDIFCSDLVVIPGVDGDVQIPGKNIYSFVNCFNLERHFVSDWELFQQIEQRLPDWNFKAFGGQCRDGSMDGSQALADKMREARFIWHTKNFGDGYGHVIHNIAAVARPMIVKKQYYEGKLANDLIIDGQTAIVIDGLTNDQIIEKILYYSDSIRYNQLCLNVYRNFKLTVNFDAEYAKIQEFLQNLK